MRTAVCTYRLTHGTVDQLAKEAERRRSTSVDIVRIAIAEYFQHRQMEAALLGLEQRMINRFDAHNRQLSAALEKIFALASEPTQNGGAA